VLAFYPLQTPLTFEFSIRKKNYIGGIRIRNGVEHGTKNQIINVSQALFFCTENAKNYEFFKDHITLERERVRRRLH
jgi:hypothetical protein